MHASLNWFSVFKVAVLYAGPVIGAGFASGQEILQFFIVFGKDGLYGVMLSTALFSYLGGLLMFLSISAGSNNYRDLYRIILGRLPTRIMDLMSLFILPGGVVVMLVGGGAVFYEHLGLPQFLGTLLTALITATVISVGLQGVISANAVLVPVKMAAIMLICLLALTFTQPPPDTHLSVVDSLNGRGINWVWSSLLYVSYNMVVPAAVLSSLGRSVSLRSGVLGGMLGGVLLGGLAFLIVFTGLCFYPHVTGYEIPMLFIAGNLGSFVKIVLGILIWTAILTTAIANVHGFASRLAESHSVRYTLIGIGLILFSLPLSTFKFSLLVKVLYPLFGYAGLILLAALLIIPPVIIIRRKFM